MGVVSIPVVREGSLGKSHSTRLEGNAAANTGIYVGLKGFLAVSRANAKAKEADMWHLEGTAKRPPWLEGSEQRKSERFPCHKAFTPWQGLWLGL